MSDELTNTNVPRIDGFDDHEVGGDSIRVIQGEKWSFTNEGTWVNADDLAIPRDREVVVVDVKRVLQKWVDKTPVSGATRFLASGDQVDVEQLNEACPRSEWSQDLNGKPRGPWQVQEVVYMVDMETMQRFTYPTSTVGGSIAINELKDAVKLMRQFKGAGAYPVVSLADKHMNTKFGGRQRPHFIIRRWISFGPDGTASLPGASSQSPQGLVEHKAAPHGARVVEEPTLHEQMDDDIPF